MANKTSLVLIFFFISVTTIHAQGRWSATFRPVLNFPTSSIEQSNLRVGNGFELTTAYTIMPHLEVYAGWGWTSFDSDEDFTEENINYEESGYTLGGRLVIPINKSKLKYFVKGGIVLNKIEVERSETSIKAKTDREVGVQLGAGVQILIYKHWNLVPELRYRGISSSLDTENTSTNIDLKYISLGVGLRYSL